MPVPFSMTGEKSSVQDKHKQTFAAVTPSFPLSLSFYLRAYRPFILFFWAFVGLYIDAENTVGILAL